MDVLETLPSERQKLVEDVKVIQSNETDCCNIHTQHEEIHIRYIQFALSQVVK